MWVALDDLDLIEMNPTKIDETHFVRTDDEVGLTEEKMMEVIEKLKIDSQPPI